MTTAVTIAPSPILQFLNNQGQPNVGGSVLTQVGGVNTATYQDSAGNVPLPNPIPLNNRGEISNSSGISCQLFLVTGVVYTFTLFDAQGNQLNQASYVTTSNALATFIANLASSIGSTLVGYLSSLSGAVLRLLQDKLDEIVDVADFLPIGYVKDGSVDYNVAIQAAINALFGVGGGTLNFPRFPLSHGATPLAFKNNITYKGKNRKVSKLIYTGTTDQILTGNITQLNGSTDASINIEDLWLSASNLAAYNGNLFDTGSSELHIKGVMFDSNQIGVIWDQTELSSIEKSYFNGQAGAAAGIWLVNGADKNVGSLVGFTNQLKFDRNQFNGSGAWISVVDDGGNDHTFSSNNLNGGTSLIRFAACNGFQVIGGEYEVWTGSGMIAAATKWKGATAFFSNGISFRGGDYFIPGTNAVIDMQVLSTPSLSIEDASFITAGNPYANMANVGELYAKGNTQGGAGSGFTAINNQFSGKAFTLTWTAAGTAPVLGNGTLTGTWSRQGRWNEFTINLVAGSTTMFGTGNWSFSVPVAEGGVGAVIPLSMVCAGAFYSGVGRVTGATLNSMFSASNTGVSVSVTVPGAWTTTNSLVASGGYLSNAPI